VCPFVTADKTKPVYWLTNDGFMIYYITGTTSSINRQTHKSHVTILPGCMVTYVYKPVRIYIVILKPLSDMISATYANIRAS